jgi:hypothetical protein
MEFTLRISRNGAAFNQAYLCMTGAEVVAKIVELAERRESAKIVISRTDEFNETVGQLYELDGESPELVRKDAEDTIDDFIKYEAERRNRPRARL